MFCVFSWFDVVKILSIMQGMNDVKLYMSCSIHWRSLMMPVNNNRNTQDRLSVKGQLQSAVNTITHINSMTDVPY
jgi:hypothetical protein